MELELLKEQQRLADEAAALAEKRRQLEEAIENNAVENATAMTTIEPGSDEQNELTLEQLAEGQNREAEDQLTQDQIKLQALREQIEEEQARLAEIEQQQKELKQRAADEARAKAEEQARLAAVTAQQIEENQLAAQAQQRREADEAAELEALRIKAEEEARLLAQQLEEKRRLTEEQRIAEEIARIEEQKVQLAKLAEEIKAAEEKTRLAKLEEEKEATEERARLAKLEEEQKATEERARLAKLEEEQQAAEEKARLAKLEKDKKAAEEKARLARLEKEKKAAEEKARKAEEAKKQAALAALSIPHETWLLRGGEYLAGYASSGDGGAIGVMEKVVADVAAVLRRNNAFNVTQQFSDGAIFSRHPINSERLYSDGGIGRKRPSLDFIYRHASAAELDAVIAFWIRTDGTGSKFNVELFLVDVQQHELHSIKANQGAVREQMEKLLAMFVASRNG